MRYGRGGLLFQYNSTAKINPKKKKNVCLTSFPQSHNHFFTLPQAVIHQPFCVFFLFPQIVFFWFFILEEGMFFFSVTVLHTYCKMLPSQSHVVQLMVQSLFSWCVYQKLHFLLPWCIVDTKKQINVMPKSFKSWKRALGLYDNRLCCGDKRFCCWRLTFSEALASTMMQFWKAFLLLFWRCVSIWYPCNIL